MRNDPDGNPNLAFSLPSGICRGDDGQVGTTGAFEDPTVASLWLLVSPIVASTRRKDFTDLQTHLNNDGHRHTDQSDFSPSVLLVIGKFERGGLWLHPPGEPAVEVRATQYTFEFDGNTPHSVDDIGTTPSC